MSKNKKKRLKPKPVIQRTRAADTARAAAEKIQELKQILSDVPPDTIMHVGEQMTMTEAALQQHLEKMLVQAKEFGIYEDGDWQDNPDALYEVARASLGLKLRMPAGELLDRLDQESQQAR